MDISFLETPRLVGEFAVTQLPASAARCLALMDTYKCLNPCYMEMIAVLDASGQNHHYDSHWVASVRAASDEVLAAANQVRIDAETDDDAIDDLDADNLVLFATFKSVIILYFMQSDFQRALYYVHAFTTLLQFTSQPADHGAVAQNRFFEFYFYHFVLLVYGSVWGFQSTSATTPAQNIESGNFQIAQRNELWKACEAVLKKVNFYYNKNEVLLKSGSPAVISELKFYWSIQWITVLAQFKQNKVHDFLTNFHTIASSPSYILKTSTFDIVADDLNFSCEILVMICFASILVKPFKDLSFISQSEMSPLNQKLVDMFASGVVLESKVYHILLDLKANRLASVKAAFVDNSFLSDLEGKVGFLLPAKDSKPFKIAQFIQFIELIIDLKSFLLIMSVTRQISRRTILRKLGYTNEPEEKLEFVCNNLLILLSCLSLGDLDMGYDAHNGIFYNHGNQQRNTLVSKELLREEVLEMQHILESDAMANLVKGMLVEKYSS